MVRFQIAMLNLLIFVYNDLSIGVGLVFLVDCNLQFEITFGDVKSKVVLW